MATDSERLKSLRVSSKKWYSDIYGYTSSEIPKEGDETVADFVYQLWKDSNDWRKRSFSRIGDGANSYPDPLDWWRAARKLEQGHHWEVWGERNVGDDDKWKAQLVDDEVSNQQRVKKSYLTANWHDVTIMPSIGNIGEVFDQERSKTHWGPMITQGVHRALNEGMCVFKTILDKTEDPDGLVREILLDNAGIFPTPYSTGITKIEGTWHLVHATLQSLQQLHEDHPDMPELTAIDANLDEIAKFSRLDFNQTTPQQLQQTKLVPVLELWMDDPQTVRATHDPEESDAEQQAVDSGIAIDNDPKWKEIFEEQNHSAHVKDHMAWLEQINSLEPQTDEEKQALQQKTEYMAYHIEDHLKKMAERKLHGKPIGSYAKYPFGRKIQVCAGVVLEDEPNPHEFDWRKIFNAYYCEKLPDSWWGRGMTEILYNTNKTEDTMLSRTADISLSVGQPKEYFDINDKDAVEEQGLNNDPTQPGFVSKPPVFRQAQSPPEQMQIYQIMKQNAEKTQGVGSVTYGKAPNAQASGKLMDTLLAQNQIVVTGEGNQNLSDTVENIVETRIKMWRKYYTEPRWYFIHGEPQAINVSKMVSKFKTKNEKGEVEEKDIPDYEITVRPNSNFPRKFEDELAFLLQLSQTPSPDGTPYVPREAIVDILAEKYPKLGRDGVYYKMSEALKVGMGVLAEQQKKQEADQKTLRTFSGMQRKEGMKELMGKGVLTRQGEPTNDEAGTDAASAAA